LSSNTDVAGNLLLPAVVSIVMIGNVKGRARHGVSGFATVVLLLAIAATGFGSLASAKPASAKVACGDRAADSPGELDGLPANPEAGLPYRLSVVTSNKHAVNLNPLLFLLRCVGREERDTIELPLEITLSDASHVRSDFTTKFPRPGRWQVTVMDLSGRFHDLGSYELRAAQDELDAAPDRGAATAAIVVGAGVLAAGLALAIRRKRS